MSAREEKNVRRALLKVSSLILLMMGAGCAQQPGGQRASGAPSGTPAAAPAPSVAPVGSFASKSGTIQISRDDSTVFVLGKGVTGEGSLSVLRVLDAKTGSDELTKIGEIATGHDPSSVSINPAATRAYVSNWSDNTVSVIDLESMAVVTTISVGASPRGTALSPTGATLYVANQSDGTLSVIDAATASVKATIALVTSGLDVRSPYAVTVTSNADASDDDETIFVSDFFARPRQGVAADKIEGFDDGKEGRVAVISAKTNTVEAIHALDPIQSGFTADRSKFDTANGAANDTFKSTASDVTKTPQQVFFNQLSALTIDPSTGKLYVSSIGAEPEPPVNFTTNVQALVGVLDPKTGELASEHTNLNALIKVETAPASLPNGSLIRAFAADTVDMSIRNGVVLFVSRAGSFALRGSFDASGKITLGNSATLPAIRIPTGNIPNGVVLNTKGTRGYVNAEVDRTVTAIDTGANKVLATASASELPPVGSSEHNALLGKLVFFTGMGTPAQGLSSKSVREIDTHLFRGMASNSNWSSCASCHPDGLTDHVTWIFATGPRQTISLDASFSRLDPQKQRVFNWNAVQGSITDFNNNSRGVQGGKGFTPGGDTDAGTVFNHGPNAGVSDALDLETLWVQIGIRTPRAPSVVAGNVDPGRTAFKSLKCDQCHGGDQWTSSRVRWAYPLFASDPQAATGAVALDPRVLQLGTGPVLLAFDPTGTTANQTPIVTRFTVNGAAASPTFDATSAIEIRGNGAQVAKASVGAAGSFNPPSLLGLRNLAPYGHDGRAQTLDAVFEPRAQGGLGHPTNGASEQQLTDVKAFLLTIDSTIAPVSSQ